MRTLLASTGALLVLIALPGASAGAALSPSTYGVSALCSAPAPGHAGCLGLRLVAKQPLSLSGSQESTRAAQTAGPAVKQIKFEQPWKGSLSPQNVLTAYGLSAVPAPAAQQTLALVDAFADPTAEGDLRVFDEQYDLAPCTAANGCFTKVALGTATEAGWTQETATDIEVAHGLCPSCKILLVEAKSNDDTDLEAAEEEAERLGATEISNSWGGPDEGVTAEADRHSPFNDPDTVITAAAGDDGYLNWDAEESSERGFADYPASSPHVIAVGGTHLSLNAGAWQEETVWNDDAGAGGGGCATRLTAPAWQQSLADWSSVGCGAHRAVADVSADADPYTGVAVYDSTPIREGEVEYRGWVTIGGTSVASPIIAATFALAGGAHGVAYPAATLYSHLETDLLHTVTAGGNGACDDIYTAGCTGSLNPLSPSDCGAGALICNAATGCAGLYYDGPAGVGTPDGIGAFKPEEQPAKDSQECSAQSEPVSEKGTSEGTPPEAGSGTAGPSPGETGSGSEGTGPGETGIGSEGTGPGETGRSEGTSPDEGGESEGTRSGTGPAPSEEAWKAFTGLSLPPGAQPAGPPLSIPGSSSAVLPILSAPALTHKASAALRHGPLKIATIAFAFTLNVPAHVRVVLARRVAVHGHRRWRSLPDSLAIMAAQGRDSAHLRARGTLSAGGYRLTLTPLHGTARALAFRIS